jgi:hypothetical protein
MENDMSHYTLVSGALVALALGTMISASKADMYGPRQQANGQCWVGSGVNGIAYLTSCEARAAAAAARTGATANARTARPSANKKSGQQSGQQSSAGTE